tara:strand:- start:490 stop:813 length:324 start_codon:yes stop_codon:yes gene_type:complete
MDNESLTPKNASENKDVIDNRQDQEIKDLKENLNKVNAELEKTKLKDDEDLNDFAKVVSFCFPFIGGILYLVHANKSPKKASAACNCALWGIGVGIVLNILAAIGGA